MTDLSSWLLERIAEDEKAARVCAEMFPPPWEVADRGWRVRIYASDLPIPDLMSDDEDAMTTRNPVVMEVEPDRHIEDPKWLSERVEHVRRHTPARVLAQCAAYKMVVYLHGPYRAYGEDICASCGRETPYPCRTLCALASVWADHPDYDPVWRPSDE